MSRAERTARLAGALLADRNRETTKESITCETCGRGMVDHGRRCCSPRCLQWLAAGNPAPDPGYARRVLDMPLRNWMVAVSACAAKTQGRSRRGGRQVNFIATRKREHSRKPDELYPIIEACSPGPYLELFARQRRPGWTSIGNDVDHFPIPPIPAVHDQPREKADALPGAGRHSNGRLQKGSN
jgi:MT-A70